MPQQMPQDRLPNAEDQRTDLQAMLAASRELGPEMDSSLVDSYMSRHKAHVPRPQGQAGQSFLSWGEHGMRYIGFGLLAGALVLAAILSTVWSGGGHSFWFPWFFLPWLFFLMFARRGMYRSRRSYTYTDENGQQVWVRERVRGYGSGYGSYGPRGPYSPSSSSPAPRKSSYDPDDPDGRPLPSRPDVSAASDIQSKYGAPDRSGYASEDRDRSTGN